ncbi:MAG: hypothetical protein RMA76_14615 [Deltaproteobacteria bacterium]|jgi:hypothetical protein
MKRALLLSASLVLFACGGVEPLVATDRDAGTNANDAGRPTPEPCADAEDYVGDLTLAGSELERLGSLRTISGSLELEGAEWGVVTGTVTAGLAGCLVEVGGRVELQHGIALEEDAFVALRTIRGSLFVQARPLGGSPLPVLEMVGGNLGSAPPDSELSLPALRTVGGDVFLHGSGTLGLDALTSVGGAVRATSDLVKLALPGLTHAGSIVLMSNEQLRSASFPALVETESVFVQWNPELRVVSFPALETVTATLAVFDEAIERVELEGLRTAGGVVVRNEVGRTSVRLDALEVVEDSLVLQGVESVSLERLVRVEGRFVLVRAHATRTLEIPNLARVGTLLGVGESLTMERIDLPALAEVGSLVVHLNPQLVEVRLPRLGTVHYGLAFASNNALERVVAPPIEGTVEVINVQDCPRLRSFDVTRNLRRIGNISFSSCESLASVDLSSLVEAKRIGLSNTWAPLNADALEIIENFTVDGRGPEQIDLPALESAGVLSLFETTGVVTFSTPSLTSARAVFLRDTENIESFSAPILETANALSVTNNSDLHTVELPALRGLFSLTAFNNTSWEDCEIDALRDQVLARDGIEQIGIGTNAPCTRP